MKPWAKLFQDSMVCCWPAIDSMVGGLVCNRQSWMPELMSSTMYGCVSSSHSIVQKFLISRSHLACDGNCGHCRICVVVLRLFLHGGQAANSCWQVCFIFFPVAQNPVANFEVHHFFEIVMVVMAASMQSQLTVLRSFCKNWFFSFQ